MLNDKIDKDAYAVVLRDLYKRRDEINAAISSIETICGVQKETGGIIALSRNDYAGLSIADAAKKVLDDHNEVMSSEEITEALISLKFPMKSANPTNVMASVLSRRFDSIGDIVRVGRGQWGLKEWYPGRDFSKKQKTKNEFDDLLDESASTDEDEI